MSLKKLQISQAGGFEQLKIVEAPDLHPRAGQVRVDVKGVGVNYADCLIRYGVYESAKKLVGWPITPGFEFSGYVSEIGEGVKSYKLGDPVFGVTLFNAYSSQVVVNEDLLFPVHDEKQVVALAGFPTIYFTAYHALYQLVQIYPKSKVLIHSAGGGVGTALIHLAKFKDLSVVGVIGSARKEAYLRSLGVKHIIDRSKEDFALKAREIYPQGYDVVFDATGAETFQKSYDLLAPLGKLVCYGGHSLMPKNSKTGRINYLKAAYGLLKTPKFNPMEMITSNKTVCGFNISFLFDKVELRQEMSRDLSRWLKEGQIKPIETTFIPFDNLAEAHRLLESGQTTGKIVLTF